MMRQELIIKKKEVLKEDLASIEKEVDLFKFFEKDRAENFSNFFEGFIPFNSEHKDNKYYYKVTSHRLFNLGIDIKNRFSKIDKINSQLLEIAEKRNNNLNRNISKNLKNIDRLKKDN
jgi:hypothetical protein